MQFKTILGQTQFKKNIVRLIKEHQLPHAMMLAGPEGSGNLPMALAMAQYINCKNKTDDDSCGTCPSCMKIEKLQHPDVHFSFPTIRKENASKPPISNDFILSFREFFLKYPYGNDQDWLKFLKHEKQGNITADECRSIIQKLQMRSYESEYKVFIMWYPEYLGNEGNILLKLIEEPTPKTILLFVSTQPEKVLATIQSRTQLFNLDKIQTEELQQYLVQTKHVPLEKALQIARIAEGNINYAQKLVDEDTHDYLIWLKDWLNAMYTNNGIAISDWVADKAAFSKEQIKQFLNYTLQLFEHLVRIKYLGLAKLPLLDDEKRVIDLLLQKNVDEWAIEKCQQELDNTLYYIERNANVKITLHALSLHIQLILLSKRKQALAT
ncbi:MAG: hypothetical protein R2831_00570 [Chitinophagaceae bacterium]